jgi:hypothetical protein
MERTPPETGMERTPPETGMERTPPRAGMERTPPAPPRAREETDFAPPLEDDDIPF